MLPRRSPLRYAPGGTPLISKRCTPCTTRGFLIQKRLHPAPLRRGVPKKRPPSTHQTASSLPYLIVAIAQLLRKHRIKSKRAPHIGYVAPTTRATWVRHPPRIHKHSLRIRLLISKEVIKEQLHKLTPASSLKYSPSTKQPQRTPQSQTGKPVQ